MKNASDRPTFRQILEEAIAAGVTKIEIEYVREGLEITYIEGNTGMGFVIPRKGEFDRGSDIIEALVKETGLDDYGRGRMTFKYGSTNYSIKVREYDSFGEAAFRLAITKGAAKKKGKAKTKQDADWAEAKKRCRLNDEDIRKAKELGLSPRTLIKNIPSPNQRWIRPVKEWIAELYAKREKNSKG